MLKELKGRGCDGERGLGRRKHNSSGNPNETVGRSFGKVRGKKKGRDGEERRSQEYQSRRRQGRIFSTKDREDQKGKVQGSGTALKASCSGGYDTGERRGGT